MKNPHFDAEEKEFQREIASALDKVRASVGACPHPDQLMAAAAGVQFQDAAAVREHSAACPVCQTLMRDLSSYEYPAVSDEEDRRIRATWGAATGVPRPTPGWWTWLWRPMPLAAAAFAIILVVTGALVLRQPGQRPDESAKSVQPSRIPAAAARVAFVLEKAAIKVPAAAVLVYRGDAESGKTFLNELASALEPYRMDNYAEAARRLDLLAGKYPKYAEPHYYLGVSRLFLGENEPALAALNSALPLADDSLRDDVSWYLAIALDRAGRSEDARREVEGLCGHAGEYQQRACASVGELRR
ncbi:MAG TPA: hypothetical protein VE422_44485 [Terriglobia bacterium]|nr:hypothetical protein [Terriglobia bacterium]